MSQKKFTNDGEDGRKNHKHYTNKQIVDVYIENLCHLKKTADTLGMSRQNLWYKIKHDDELKETLEQVSQLQIQYVEEHLMGKIEEGYFPAIKFYLESKAKHKGYGSSLEITTPRPIRIINSNMTPEQAVNEYQEMIKNDSFDLIASDSDDGEA